MKYISHKGCNTLMVPHILQGFVQEVNMYYTRCIVPIHKHPIQMILSYEWSFDSFVKVDAALMSRTTVPKGTITDSTGFVFIFIFSVCTVKIWLLPTPKWKQDMAVMPHRQAPGASLEFFRISHQSGNFCFCLYHEAHKSSNKLPLLSSVLCTSFILNTVILKMCCKISALVLHSQSEVLHGNLNMYMFISILHLFLLLLLTTPCLICLLLPQLS